VIVNASLAGCADSACNELQEFSSGAGSRWSGHQKYCRAASLEKIVMWSCSVIVNASLAGVAPDSA
jgi:hypothetical protein